MQEALNRTCDTSVYSLSTQHAMAQLSEKEIPFELIEALLNYFRSLNTPGAVLIFLPGWNSIFALLRHLSGHNVFGKGRQYQKLKGHTISKSSIMYFVLFVYLHIGLFLFVTIFTRFQPVSSPSLPLPDPPRGPEEGF